MSAVAVGKGIQSNAVVAVVGAGKLAELVCTALLGPYEVMHFPELDPGRLNPAQLVLVLRDDWRSSDRLEAERVLQPAGIPWLGGFISADEAVVGPLVRPGTPGCSQCAELRLLNAGSRSAMSEQQLNRLLHGGAPPAASPPLFAFEQAACLIAAEARRVLLGYPAYTDGRVYMMNLNTLDCSLHAFLPDPQCAVCGEMPDDTASVARITLKPNLKLHPSNYRIRKITNYAHALARDYLDERTGLLNKIAVQAETPFADVCAYLPSFGSAEITAGRSHSYETSRQTAILEGLERYCGMAPHGKRTAVRGSFRQLSDHALDPAQVGLYTEEQYARPDFPFRPFDPGQAIDWVWGYSFLQQSPILVPESLAYYDMGCGQAVGETSNGCALGGSVEEAIFHGILEVVERDAFLMTWYARLPVPSLDPRTAHDAELQLMIDRLRAVIGYDIQLFNITTENKIPSIWALAINRKEKGVYLASAAGAHPDPVRAAKSAIHEVAGMIPAMNRIFTENRDRLTGMLHDSSLVRTMEDHFMMNGLPEARGRFQFLLEGKRAGRSFDEEFLPPARHADLTDDLRDVLRAFGRLKLDVIAVDQTSPEILRNGLRCVKVLIPGMLPMTFGHHLTRTAGLDRIWKVPMALGYVKQPLAPDQLNPYPHPFP